jgi:hypothetical protein
MKNHNIILAILATSLLLIITGCDNALQEQEYSKVPQDQFYKTKVQAERALTGIYEGFWRKTYRDGSWVNENDESTNILRGNPTTTHAIEFDSWTWTDNNGNLGDLAAGVYRASSRANALIDHLKKNEQISKSDKDNIIGQAEFIRALDYFNAVRMWGGIPLYKHQVTDIKDVAKPRAPADSVYQWIITNLKDAANRLGPFSESDQEAGRVTSGAARALLGKVYLQHRQWKKAADELKKVIDSGHYKLFKDYAHIFENDYQNRIGWIFITQYGQLSDAGSNGTQHLGTEFSPEPLTLPDGTHIKFFKYTGQGTNWAPQQKFYDEAPNTYRKRMTMRKKMYFYYKLTSSGAELVQDTVTLDHPYIVKFYHILDKTSGTLQRAVGYPIVRYAGVLLMYAEALNEANSSPPPAAYQAINKVRAQARGVGTPHQQPKSVYPPLSGLTKVQFRDSVLTEEAREFIGEGHRRFELLRHHLFTKQAKSDPMVTGNITKNDTLFPLPASEVNRNPNMKQNPGY